MLKIYSGEVCCGEVGKAAPNGFHVGDIVMVYAGSFIGTDAERWDYTGHLTAVVDAEDGPFVMGIKSCGFEHPEWRIELVKKYSDVVPGEKWPAYGFNYREE